MVKARTTLRDVADRAGLSTAAVSQILNGRGNFPAETRRRTMEIAEAMGYRPNPLARSLASGRSHVLAVYFSHEPGVDHFFERDYIRQVYLAATEEAIDRGYTLVLGPPTSEHVIWNRIPIEGVLLVSPRRNDPVADLLCQLAVPVVVLGRDPVGRPVRTEVDYDLRAATYELLDHLSSRGARQIGYIGANLDDTFADDVENAYRAWCQEHGQIPQVGRESPEHPRESLVVNMLTHDGPPDAVFGDTWELGQLIARQADWMGISTPNELLVAAFGDSDAKSQADVTSVQLLPEDAALMAVRTLTELIAGKTAVERVTLRHHLRLGQTTSRR